MNRPEFLERLLAYYGRQGLKEKIFVADSSDDDHANDVRAVIKNGPKLNIEYRPFGPNVRVEERFAETLDEVDTEFVAPTADDDFFTIPGLGRAVDFLRTHPDHSVVHGHSVIFDVNPGPVYGDRLLTSRYNQRSIQQASASERLLDHFTHYTTNWYSTHRTANLKNNMKKIADLHLDDVELIASGLCVAQGKTRKLDGLYMVRQTHPTKRMHFPDAFDWISKPEWAAQYTRLETCLSEALVLQDRVPTDSARATVKQAFWKYLSDMLTNGWRSRYAPDTKSVAHLKSDLAEWAPSLLHAWQQVRALLPGEETQSLFPALLKSSSPYHRDFMPIYRAIARA